MVPTSPAKLIEIKIDELESPFVDQQSKGWKITKMFSCCTSSSKGTQMEPVYCSEDGPFRPTQSSDHLASPPPSPILMGSCEKLENGISDYEKYGYGSISNDFVDDKNVRLVVVQRQAEALRQRIDQLQKENSELKLILTHSETRK